MSEEKRKPIPLSKLMHGAAVPMPASGGAPAGAGGNGGGYGGRGRPVPRSRDLDRIMALPRREPLDLKSTRASAMVDLITSRYTNGKPADTGCRCRELDPNRFKGGGIGCITDVLPIQAWMLYELGLAGGGIGSIVVGGGKTILNILAIFSLGVQKALVLIPSNLLKQFWLDYQLLAEHFKVPSVWIEGINRGREIPGMPKIYVLPYGLLSRPGRSGYIDDLKPEAIICDETDKLADIRGSATARRVLRYYVDAPHTKFAGWTGSLTDKKLSEYAHLIVMALKDNAPVPHDPQEVTNWGECIDVSECPAEPGALTALFNTEEHLLAASGEDGCEQRAARRAYGRRLCDTLGIVTTSEGEVEVSGKKGVNVEMIVCERPAPVIPPRIQMALQYARGNVRPDKELGFSPDNEELDSPMDKARTIMEIASGIMNVWEFWPTNPERTQFVVHPCSEHKVFTAVCGACMQRSIDRGGVPQEETTIDRWYEARAPWNKAVRSQCLIGRPFMDSPYLCELAAARAHGDLPEDYCDHTKPKCDRSKMTPEQWALKHPQWLAPEWPDWNEVRKKVKPKAVSKRIDPFLVNDAAKWALDNQAAGRPGIVWYSLVEFGEWVAEVSGLPLHGGGPKAEDALKAERGDRSIIASIDSHGRGRNGLQFLYSTQLISQIPSSARRWEQLLGRLVRRGQRSDEVLTWIYMHVPELRSAVEQALKRGEYAQETVRMQQKLLTSWKKYMVDEQ